MTTTTPGQRNTRRDAVVEGKGGKGAHTKKISALGSLFVIVCSFSFTLYRTGKRSSLGSGPLHGWGTYIECMKTVEIFCKYLGINSINMFPEIQEVNSLKEPTMSTTMTGVSTIYRRETVDPITLLTRAFQL